MRGTLTRCGAGCIQFPRELHPTFSTDRGVPAAVLGAYMCSVITCRGIRMS
jgi:hypothetical protein